MLSSCQHAVSKNEANLSATRRVIRWSERDSIVDAALLVDTIDGLQSAVGHEGVEARARFVFRLVLLFCGKLFLFRFFLASIALHFSQRFASLSSTRNLNVHLVDVFIPGVSWTRISQF